MTLELRAGVKSGESADFYVPSDSDPSLEKGEQSFHVLLLHRAHCPYYSTFIFVKGAISGWVQLSVGLEEDVTRLFGSDPYECPAAPPDPLNLNTLNLHISRLSDFVEDIISL